MVKRISILVLALLLMAAAVCVHAEPNGRAILNGMLSSIEPDGTVIIDDRGYAVQNPVRVLDPLGKSTSLDKLELPAKVQCEVKYYPEGPIIVVIRQIGL